LEADKIITRTVYAEVPPRVEYELTEIGYELKPIIEALTNWSKDIRLFKSFDVLLFFLG